MYTVYILEDANGKRYKGSTNNLVRRLREHRGGHTRTTSRMENIVVIYTEEYATEQEARIRERYLKTAAGRRLLKKILGA